MSATIDPRKGKGKAGEGPADGPARVVKPGDWGAVRDSGMKGFTMAAFAVPGRAPPKPDPAEMRNAALAAELKKAEESRQAGLARAARESEAAVQAALARGREEGKVEGEKAASEKYAKSVEELRRGVRGVLTALSQEKEALFLDFEGQAVALAAAAIRRVFDGMADRHAEAVLPLLRKAITALGEGAGVLIKVNPADLQVVDENRNFWLPVDAALKDIRILAEPRVTRGGCFVESDSTSVEMAVADLGERIAEELGKVFAAKSRAIRGPAEVLSKAAPLSPMHDDADEGEDDDSSPGHGNASIDPGGREKP